MLPAEQVQVEMRDFLPAVHTGIGDSPETAGRHIFIGGYFGHRAEKGFDFSCTGAGAGVLARDFASADGGMPFSGLPFSGVDDDAAA